MKFVTREVDGQAYKVLTTLDDPAFVGILDISPDGGFAIAVGKRLGTDQKLALFIAGGNVAWELPFDNPMDVRIIDGGYAAFIDRRQLVVADVRGVMFRVDYPPPHSIGRFAVAPGGGWLIESGRFKWHVDFTGRLTDLSPELEFWRWHYTDASGKRRETHYHLTVDDARLRLRDPVCVEGTRELRRPLGHTSEFLEQI